MDLVHATLSQSYWSPGIRRDVVEAAVRNSDVVGVYFGGQQVAYARVVTDHATIAYLCDVFVVTEHQGKGIGRAMVSAFLNQPQYQTVRRWLLATRDAQELYRPLGFTEVHEGRWMEIRMPSENWT